jgi:hypothetical protein
MRIPKDENNQYGFNNVRMSEHEEEVFKLLCMLALFGGILLALISAIMCYCWRQNQMDLEARMFYLKNVKS